MRRDKEYINEIINLYRELRSKGYTIRDSERELRRRGYRFDNNILRSVEKGISYEEYKRMLGKMGRSKRSKKRVKVSKEEVVGMRLVGNYYVIEKEFNKGYVSKREEFVNYVRVFKDEKEFKKNKKSLVKEFEIIVREGIKNIYETNDFSYIMMYLENVKVYWIVRDTGLLGEKLVFWYRYDIENGKKEIVIDGDKSLSKIKSLLLRVKV